MAIYGIGAYYDGDDVSEEFIDNNIIGTGWSITDAPDVHEYFTSLKAGDIIYIKAAAFGSTDISIKGIGVITDNVILTLANHDLTQIGRNVRWLNTEKFSVPRPAGKNNVMSNTIYEEFHPLLQQEIILRI